jgi:DNA repair protein RecO (recombination protein O)
VIRKTEAIVLNTRKFSESSLITTLYTFQYGKQSYFVRGYRSSKAKKKHSYFQPMSVIDIVFYHKDGRDLQTITETENKVYFNRLQSDPVRITLGLMAVEIFYRSVKEAEQDSALYLHLRNTLVKLESRNDKLIHIFIYYFLHLTGPLGLLPRDEVEDESRSISFGLPDGAFVNGPGTGADRALREFLHADFETCTEIVFNNEDKKEMVSKLLLYYRIHVENFRDPESMKVFEEVFG